LAIEIWKIGDEQNAKFVLNGEPMGIDLFDGEALVDYGDWNHFLDTAPGFTQFLRNDQAFVNI
jgi:hypothetical protein